MVTCFFGHFLVYWSFKTIRHVFNSYTWIFFYSNWVLKLFIYVKNAADGFEIFNHTVWFSEILLKGKNKFIS